MHADGMGLAQNLAAVGRSDLLAIHDFAAHRREKSWISTVVRVSVITRVGVRPVRISEDPLYQSSHDELYVAAIE